MLDIYQINVGLITYMKMKGTELLGAVQTSNSPHRVSAFVGAISSDVLALVSGSYFQFYNDGNPCDGRVWQVFHDDATATKAGGPFISWSPYYPGNPVMFLTESDSDAGDDGAPSASNLSRFKQWARSHNPVLQLNNFSRDFDNTINPNQ